MANQDLTERRAEFVCNASRLAAIGATAPIVSVVWAKRGKAFRSQFLKIIERQCGENCSNSPEELHSSWMQSYFDMGWVYGEKYDRENKTHPDLVAYTALGLVEKDKDEIFIALCEIARQWIN
ncbi:ryR domain protein [Patescibacteria group bacterium]|nr:ryR domain protein [Patescibacteria group bacterium]